MSLVQVLGCRAIGAVSPGCGSAGLYAPALPALAPHATSVLNPSFIPPCCEQCGLTFDCGLGLTSGALPYIHAVGCRALGAMSPGCGSARLCASALPALALHATSLLNPSFPAIQCGFTSDCGLGLSSGGYTLHSCAGLPRPRRGAPEVWLGGASGPCLAHFRPLSHCWWVPVHVMRYWVQCERP